MRHADGSQHAGREAFLTAGRRGIATTGRCVETGEARSPGQPRQGKGEEAFFDRSAPITDPTLEPNRCRGRRPARLTDLMRKIDRFLTPDRKQGAAPGARAQGPSQGETKGYPLSLLLLRIF